MASNRETMKSSVCDECLWLVCTRSVLGEEDRGVWICWKEAAEVGCSRDVTSAAALVGLAATELELEVEN